MEENIDVKKRDKLMVFTFASLAFSLVSSITYMIYTFIANKGMIDHVVSIISVCILVALSIILVVSGFFIENKKAKIWISVAALILALYSIFQVVIGITTPKDLMPDFVDENITDVIEWAKDRNIELEKVYEYDLEIEEDYVIKQSVKEGTPVKKIKKLTVTVSKGIDPRDKAEISDMTGWDLDDVIKFVDKNHLTNVTIEFEFNNEVERDKIISQDVVKEVKLTEPITLVSSLGKESDFPTIKLDSIVGMDLFHAKVYLGRNNIKYSIEYGYSKDKKEGTVLKQSLKKWTVISPKEKKEMVITIASTKQVTVPDLTKMKKADITSWAKNSNVRIDYKEEYDDTIKEGNVISCNYNKGAIVNVNSVISVVISKGQVKMIEFTDLDEFRNWADEREISYNIEYEYNDEVEKGKLIYISHKKGDPIKNTDTIKIIISYGGNTTVPNLVGLSKEDAKTRCNSSHVKCSFTGDDNGTVTKQSMSPDSTVPTGTTITVTVSK